jgi:hypothetical protein
MIVSVSQSNAVSFSILINYSSQPDTRVIPGQTNVGNAVLEYNEYIAYDVAQVRLRYLFRVKMIDDFGW